MWRLWRKILWRLGVGHRAAFIIGFGAVYVLLGSGVILSPAPPDPLLFHTGLPHWFRFLLWSLCGLVALIVANHARYQWIAFIVLSPPPIERCASYAMAVFQSMPFGPPIPWPYMTGLGLYGLILFLIGNASDWPDPAGDPPLLGKAD